jgi:SAM-dependent methyltransferase
MQAHAHPHTPSRQAHSHMWLVGMLCLAAGLALMLYVPSLKAISASITLFAGFHLIGALVALTSLYATVGKRLRRKARDGALDFGWAPAWTLGPLMAAMVLMAATVAIQIAAPHWWPLAMAATLLACTSFAGYLFTVDASKPEHASLPWVDLGLKPGDHLLDGGCGAGRTSIAIARALPGVHVIALDRFDADYIEQGGRELLTRNLGLAGLADRVTAQAGDLTALPFPDGSFDGAVSAHAIDHLGAAKAQGLSEMHRVLKPGGRFLLIVWVPGWAMFAVANVLAFSLTRPSSWRAMAQRAGFALHQEGSFNGHWFAVLERPLNSPP